MGEPEMNKIGYPQTVGRNRVKYGTVIEGIRRVTLLD